MVQFPVTVTAAAVVVPSPEPTDPGTTLPSVTPVDPSAVPVVAAPGSGLANTGAQVSAVLPIAALVLLLAGAGVFVASRRKRALAAATAESTESSVND